MVAEVLYISGQRDLELGINLVVKGEGNSWFQDYHLLVYAIGTVLEHEGVGLVWIA